MDSTHNTQGRPTTIIGVQTELWEPEKRPIHEFAGSIFPIWVFRAY